MDKRRDLEQMEDVCWFVIVWVLVALGTGVGPEQVRASPGGKPLPRPDLLVALDTAGIQSADAPRDSASWQVFLPTHQYHYQPAFGVSREELRYLAGAAASGRLWSAFPLTRPGVMEGPGGSYTGVTSPFFPRR